MSTIPALIREPERAEHATSSRAEFVAVQYFLVALAAFLFLYLLPFVAIRTGINPRWTTSYWGQVVDTSYHADHQDADVLVFGDSTAATNFDPVSMSRDLGMKVLVLPSVSTSLNVSGFGPLERYLHSNRPPKLIVFYLSAWDLDFLHHPFTKIDEEGEEMLLMHGSWPEMFAYLRKHARKVVLFPLHFYAISNHFADLVYLRGHEAPTLAQGHILQLQHPFPMSSGCEFDQTRIGFSAADTSIREGVQEFTKAGTQTVVMISPLPNCRHIELVKQVTHPGLDVPPIQVLPPSSFREDTWQAHMLSRAIGPSTEYLENVVRMKLGLVDASSGSR